MPAPRLRSALTSFSRSVADARDLADEANKWSIPPQAGARPQITLHRRDTLTEMAFLRAYTSWEKFLEDTFLLYLLGHRPPKGPPPRRFGFPPDPLAADEWCRDGKPYAKWNVTEVQRRANRWFKDGKPFAPALQSKKSRLDQLVTIRNAIAHKSSSVRDKFENLVRLELGAVPPSTSVGSFLMMTKPNSAPLISFLEFYVGEILQAAQDIVPK
jgi:hypothetical protein